MPCAVKQSHIFSCSRSTRPTDSHPLKVENKTSDDVQDPNRTSKAKELDSIAVTRYCITWSSPGNSTHNGRVRTSSRAAIVCLPRAASCTTPINLTSSVAQPRLPCGSTLPPSQLSFLRQKNIFLFYC